MRRGAVFLLLIIAILLPTGQSPVTAVTQPPQLITAAGDERFGINFVNSPEVNTSLASTVPTRYQQATEAGARWTRWPMYWHDIEKNPGSRDYSIQEAVLNLDRANGLETHIILMGTPNWAATSGDPTAPFPKIGERSFSPKVTPLGIQPSSVVGPPQGLYLAWNDRNNHWGQYVFSTVSRYKDRVKVWEMWNEPDYSIFWTGSVADYYQLLKVGYQAAKAADPQATVLFAGLAFWSNQSFFPAILDRAVNDPDGRGAGFYFDALPWHPYIDPYYIYDWAQRARSQMQQKLGIVKPIWVNETNVPVCGEWPGSCDSWLNWRATLEEQSSYVIQAYAYAYAADVQRLSIFQLRDDGLVPEDYYGLSTNGGVTRPAYRSYQVAATYLSRPARVSRVPGAGLEKIVLEGTPQGKVTVVWATQGNDVVANIPANSVSARLVDLYGNSANVTPIGGYYNLALPRATNNRDPSGRYVIGGKPYLLVEPVFHTLTSQVKALPTYATGRSFLVEWARLDVSGVSAVFDVQYRVEGNTTWSDWLAGTTLTSATFGPLSPAAVQDGKTYYFRSRLRDGNGGAELYPDDPNGDTQTIVPFFLSGKVRDNRAVPIAGATVSASGIPSSVTTDSVGGFSLATPPGINDIAARMDGYGILASRRLSIIASSPYAFFLPPADNRLQNWDFEGAGGVNEWWTPTGVVTASADWMHSGTKSAKLGEWNDDGDGSISQANISIPPGTYKPTISFIYGVLSPGGAGDSFTLAVSSATVTTTYQLPLDTQGVWAHKWFDLGNISSTVTVTFSLNKASKSNLRVFLDEVSVGKTTGGANILLFPVSRKGY